MSTDSDFLSPRTLLVNGSFCCDGPSFQSLSDSIKSVEGLPLNTEDFRIWCGLSPMGNSILMGTISPISDECYNIRAESNTLGVGYRKIGDICDNTLTLASTAEEDYDAIFTDLATLNGNPDDDALRLKVQTTINDRLGNVRSLADLASTITSMLKESTYNVIDAQAKLKDYTAELSSQATEDKLRKEDSPDNLEDDLSALKWAIDKLSSLNMKDESASSLQNLELLLSAVNLIKGDLNALVEYIEAHTSPANGLVLNLEEAKLLRKWSDLATEVQQFKDSYIAPSL